MKSISIIVPSYKPDENYIVKCIKSFLNSFTSVFESIEIIIIVNGCEKSYYDKMKIVFKDYDFITILFFEEGGVSNARNKGLDIVKGEYIMFIDDDDLLEFSSVLYASDLIPNNINEIVVFNTQCYNEDENTYYNDYLSNTFNKVINTEYNLIDYRSFYSVVWGKVFNRNLIGNIRFNTKLSISEDALFMFELSSNVKNIRLSNSIKYVRRVRNISLSNKKRNFKDNFSITQSFISALIKVFFKKPSDYNFIFFVTRILGALKYLISKI